MQKWEQWEAKDEDELVSKLEIAERFAMKLEVQLLQHYVNTMNDLYTMRATYGHENDIVDTVEEILERAKKRARSGKSDLFSGLPSKRDPL